MTAPSAIVFLLDVDNTLLDNDRVVADLDAELRRELGEDGRTRYWTIFEQLRVELGYADYLGACQRFRQQAVGELRIVRISLFLLEYPFADRLYPGTLDVIDHLRAWGPTVVLSDGDVVLQPLKIHRCGVSAAVEDRVLIYVHKEQMLADVALRFPAAHYVAVDDKRLLLGSMKTSWCDRLTTVWPRQGHYATDPQQLACNVQPDLTVERIGDLASVDLTSFLGNAARRRAAAEQS